MKQFRGRYRLRRKARMGFLAILTYVLLTFINRGSGPFMGTTSWLNRSTKMAQPLVVAVPSPSTTATTGRSSRSIESPGLSSPTDLGNNNALLLLPPGIRLCRLTDPAPRYGEPRVMYPFFDGTSRLMTTTITNQTFFRYQCAGKPYDDFTVQYLFPLIRKKHQEDPSLQWGKRSSIVPITTKPSNHSNNDNHHSRRQSSSILIIGNSHTRQMVESLLCQYKEQILSRHLLFPEAPYAMAVQFSLAYNLTVNVIINHPFVYSPRWKQTLEEDILKHPIRQLDAIVLGTFNTFIPRFRNYLLWKDVARYAQEFPHHQVDMDLYPTLTTKLVMEQYSGPIVWHSMLSQKKNSQLVNEAQQLQQQQRKNNTTTNTTSTTLMMRVIDARKYVGEMNGTECSSNDPTTVQTCITNRTDKNYRDGHRCMGDKGGQPDLLAWDVVEALHDIFSTSSSSSSSARRKP